MSEEKNDLPKLEEELAPARIEEWQKKSELLKLEQDEISRLVQIGNEKDREIERLRTENQGLRSQLQERQPQIQSMQRQQTYGDQGQHFFCPNVMSMPGGDRYIYWPPNGVFSPQQTVLGPVLTQQQWHAQQLLPVPIVACSMFPQMNASNPAIQIVEVPDDPNMQIGAFMGNVLK